VVQNKWLLIILTGLALAENIYGTPGYGMAICIGNSQLTAIKAALANPVKSLRSE